MSAAVVVTGTVGGLLLAAGSGRRMGRPKALVVDADGPWVTRAVAALAEGGCAEVVVVLGAGAEAARRLLADADAPCRVVVAADHATGLSASLTTGLAHVDPAHEAALVMLVDLPDVDARAVARVADRASSGGLVRAAYDGRPGHPVAIGRDHWAGVVDGARGDQGARDYLAGRDVTLVECGDLASGRDVDHPT